VTFALSGRGLPAGAQSKTAESVEGTSNDTVGSTSNGIANGMRSHSTYAGGGDHPHGLSQLTEDHAAAAGAAPVEAKDGARGQATRGRLRPSHARWRARATAAVTRAAARAGYGRVPATAANAEGNSATTFLVSLRALARFMWKPS